MDGIDDDAVEVSGTLMRQSGGFALRSDDGDIFQLLLPRVPVDLVEKRAIVTGKLIDSQLIDADGIAPG